MKRTITNLMLRSSTLQMRVKYKNPKELTSKLRDLIDTYLEGLIEPNKFSETVSAIIDANHDRIYKNGVISKSLVEALGEERTKIINSIIVNIKH